MDITLVFAILSMILMIGTNISLKYRYVTLMEAFGFACVAISFAALCTIGADQKLLLVIEGLSVLAAGHVVYFSDILKYSGRSYHELNQRLKFYNISFYVLSAIFIFVETEIYSNVVSHVGKLELSTILFLVFVKLIISSILFWNRGNIYFKAIPPRNKNKPVLYIIDFVSIAIYIASIILSNTHDRIVLLILAVAIIVVKTLNFIVFTMLFTNLGHDKSPSLMSVSSLILFAITSFVGLTICMN